MRIILFLCLLTLPIIAVQASDPDVSDLRQELFALNTDSRLAEDLLIKLDDVNYLSPLILAYKATCEAHMAKASGNPFAKFRYLNRANKHLAEAIDRDQFNLEIRFLRFALQVQTPKFLGYSKHIAADREVIMQNFNTYNWDAIDREILAYILDFMMEQGDCSESEKVQLQKFRESLRT